MDIWHLLVLSICTHERVQNLKKHQQLASISWTTQMEKREIRKGKVHGLVLPTGYKTTTVVSDGCYLNLLIK